MTPTATHAAASDRLGAIVADVPARADVLDRLGVDYAAGGRRSVAEAAASAGLDADELCELLAAHDRRPDVGVPDWSLVPPARLADQLVRDHAAFLARLVLPAQAALERLALSADCARPALVALCDRLATIEQLLADQFDEEEKGVLEACRVLDPNDTDLARAALAGIRCLADEHRRIATELRDLRRRAEAVDLGGDDAWRRIAFAIAELERAFRRHAHCEAYILPRTIALVAA